MTDIVERLRRRDEYEVILDHLDRPYGLDRSIEHEAADEIDRLRKVRDIAIKEMADMARQAGSWRGIAEGKDIVIQQLEAERERLKAIVNWLNPQGLAVGPITNTKETGHE